MAGSDVFVSYSRVDDRDGMVSRLVQEFEAEANRVLSRELRVFFDRRDIGTLQDWQNTLRSALRESAVLLVCLSENYFSSKICRWEWEEHASRTVRLQALLGGGSIEACAPVFFAEIPRTPDSDSIRAWADSLSVTSDFKGWADSDEGIATWLEATTRGNTPLDLRPWLSDGLALFSRQDVRNQMAKLANGIGQQIYRTESSRRLSGNLPRPNEFFVGRLEEFVSLNQAARTSDSIASVVLISGLGGIGKTQLTRQYAYAYRDQYPAGAWEINAEGATTLLPLLGNLGRDPRFRRDGFNLTDAARNDDRQAGLEVLEELRRRVEITSTGNARGALLLLDNIDHPGLLSNRQLSELTPEVDLFIIGSTRLGKEDFPYRTWLRFIDLLGLPEPDAIRLIELHATQNNPHRFVSQSETEALKDLVKLADGFTLVLEQIAILLVIDPRATAAALLDSLQSSPQFLESKITERRINEGVEDARHQSGLLEAVLWEVFLALADDPDPLGFPRPTSWELPDITDLSAAQLAWLVVSLFPATQVVWPWIENVIATLRPDLIHPDASGLFPLHRARKILETRSLVNFPNNSEVGTVHRLITSNLEKHVPAQVVKQGCETMLALSDNGLMGNLPLPEATAAFHPTLKKLADSLPSNTEMAMKLRSDAARWLNETGRFNIAITEFKQLLIDQQRILGSKHPGTLATRSNLATALGGAGNTGEATTLFKQLLADEIQLLGPDDPSTFVTRNNLASMLGEAGRIDDAITQFERLIKDQQQILGIDHIETLTTRHNFSSWLGEKGRITEAIEKFKQLFIDQSQALGPDHPASLRSRGSLAMLLGETGQIKESLTQLQQLLPIQQQVLGPNHPNTLTTRTHIAYRQAELGRTQEAITDLQQLTVDIEQALGSKHPDLLTIQNNLASCLLEAGRLDEAAEQFEQLVTDSTCSLGFNHPDTLVARSNLASCLDEIGHTNEAAAQFQQLIVDQQKIFGANHQTVFTSRNNLAYCLGKAGQIDEAIQQLQELLDAQQQALESEHPDLFTTRNNIADLLSQAGRLDEAADEFQKLLTDMKRIFDPEDPRILITLSNLACCLGEAGNYDEAISRLEQLLIRKTQILGPDNPSTLITRNNLASWLSEAGRMSEAIPIFEELLTDQLRSPGPRHVDTLNTRQNLAYSLFKMERYSEAKILTDNLSKDCLEILGPHHELTQTVQRLAQHLNGHEEHKS